jgi:hypothetical protein
MKLALLLERAFMEDAERDAMLAQMVKNPETNQDITVKTALGYDKNHPARKAAAKIYAQFMAKRQGGQQSPQAGTAQQKPTAQPAAKPAARPAFKKSFNRYQNKRQDPWDAQYGDDAYDAYRDYQATGDVSIAPRNQDRAYDDWGRPIRQSSYGRRRRF